MPNVINSPNMGLPVPHVSTDPGPDWAQNINASLSIIDSHNHSNGQGVQINPSGINLNNDLPFNSNNATLLRSIRFQPQSSPLSSGSDIGCLYESGVDLYYNDGNGNQIRMTASGSVTGSSGTITGLPSGTASASYSAGTFTFQSATSTPANMAIGPVTIGQNVANSKTVTISPTSGQASNYDLFLPAAAPTANQILVSDGSGNLIWTRGVLPLGAVIATFPNLSGAYSTTNTTTADANGFVLCSGQTISDSSSPMNGVVIPNIANSIFLMGSSSAGTSGGAASVTLSTGNLPSHTHGPGSYATSLSGTFASTSHDHDFEHYHQQWYISGGNAFYGLDVGSTTQGPFTVTGSPYTSISTEFVASSGSTLSFMTGFPSSGAYYGSGALPGSTSGTPSATTSLSGSNSVTGTSDSAGSGTSFSILPSYITAVYLMRIK